MTQTAANAASGSFEQAAVFTSFNPVSGESISTFPVMDAEQVAAVVAHARAASPWWASRTFAQRARYLQAWAAWLTARTDELLALVQEEQGKPRNEALLELVPTLEHIRWAAKNANRVLRRRRVRPGLMMANHTAAFEYRPHGVVGVIAPWNYPVFTPAGQMMGYALAAGNTVVLKPSEYTTTIGQFLVDGFAAANPDVPLGVVSLVTGLGETGAALCRAGVDKIAFTGSTATGKRVLAACAENLVPAVLECGGKDPMIVASDADVDAAAKAAAWGGLANSGQTCVGIEQVYVVRDVRDRFLTALERQLDGIRPGTAKDSSYGAMTVPAQVDVVDRQINEALDRGATALVGGRHSIRAPFIAPVVLVDPPDDCIAVREETFGPTLTVRTVRDVGEAVELANGRGFGLGASIFSRKSAPAIAQEVRAGMVGMNCALAFVGIPSLPFGGVGQSGFGRVHGSDGLREFAVTKSYTRQLFTIPGLDVATLRLNHKTLRIVRIVMGIRHGR